MKVLSLTHTRSTNTSTITTATLTVLASSTHDRDHLCLAHAYLPSTLPLNITAKSTPYQVYSHSQTRTVVVPLHVVEQITFNGRFEWFCFYKTHIRIFALYTALSTTLPTPREDSHAHHAVSLTLIESALVAPEYR